MSIKIMDWKPTIDDDIDDDITDITWDPDGLGRPIQPRPIIMYDIGVDDPSLVQRIKSNTRDYIKARGARTCDKAQMAVDEMEFALKCHTRLWGIAGAVLGAAVFAYTADNAMKSFPDAPNSIRYLVDAAAALVGWGFIGARAAACGLVAGIQKTEKVLDQYLNQYHLSTTR